MKNSFRLPLKLGSRGSCRIKLFVPMELRGMAAKIDENLKLKMAEVQEGGNK
jgi:hypothetical protein